MATNSPIEKALYAYARNVIEGKRGGKSTASEAELRALIAKSRAERWSVDVWTSVLATISKKPLVETGRLVLVVIANTLEPSLVPDSWGLVDRVFDLAWLDPLLAVWCVTYSVGQNAVIMNTDRAAFKAATDGVKAVKDAIRRRFDRTSSGTADRARVQKSLDACHSILYGQPHWFWGKPKPLAAASSEGLSSVRFCADGWLGVDLGMDFSPEAHLLSKYSVGYVLRTATYDALRSMTLAKDSVAEWRFASGLYEAVAFYPV